MDEMDERIRERAYQIWLDQGQPPGKEREHWEQARRELGGEGGAEGGEEKRLEEGLEETFPGSDPASETQPGGGVTGPGGRA